MTFFIKDMDERITGADNRISSTGGAVEAGLPEVLNRIEALTFGDELGREKKRVEDLRRRLAESRFHLAVLGQFKRGKTTLINALLGESLLPSAVIPVTSVPTLISWGSQTTIRVVLQGERTEKYIPEDVREAAGLLEKYVSEQGNPGNCLQVQRVEVEYPSPFLARGVVLIDTPGIGSTLKHNTEATLDFLYQCDAALFLVSADPPITQAEIEFLNTVRSKVTRLFFLLNKIDYLGKSERETAEEFLRQTLSKQGGLRPEEPIFSISARQGLEARTCASIEGWEKSGLAGVEAYLSQFLAREKTRTLNLAIADKSKEIVSDIIAALRLQERAFSLPLKDLEDRLSLLDARLQEAEQQHHVLKDLLAGELRRSRELLEDKAAAVYKQTYNIMVDAIREILAGKDKPEDLEKSARDRLAKIVSEIYGEALEKIFGEMKEQVEKSLKRYQNEAAGLVTFVRQNAAELFEIPFTPQDGTIIMESRFQPYFVSERWDCTLSLIPEGAINRFLPREKRIRRLRKQLEEDAESIALRNAGNLQWALKQNLEDTFRNFGSEVEQLLEEALEITRGATQAIYKRRVEKAGSIGPELEKLRIREKEYCDLQKQLADIVEYWKK